MLMGLRLREGVDLAVLATRFGLTEAELCDPAKLAFYRAQGLVWQRDARIGASAQGMPLLEALLGELVPAELVEP